MRIIALKYVLPFYIFLVLLDLNEFLTRLVGTDGFLTLLIFIVSIFLIMVSKPLTNRFGALSDSFLIAILGFVFLASFASIVEGNSGDIYKGIRYYSPSVLIYLATIRSVLSVREYKELYRVISFAAIAIGINGIFILLSIFFNIDFHGSSGVDKVERAVGLYSNANRAGYVSVIGQSLALMLLFSGKVRKQNFYFALYLLCLVAAISTFSKGTIILSLLIGVRMIYIGLSAKNGESNGLLKKYVQRFILVIVLLAIVSGFGFLNIGSKLTGLQSKRLNQVQLLIQGQVDAETTTHRSDLALIALEEMKDTFILGAGLGKFKRMEIGLGTHNIYLLILGESGILGLLLYLSFMGRWAFKSLLVRRFSAIKFASGNILIILLASGFAAHGLLANKQYIVAISLMIGVLRIQELTRDQSI
jgi:O-antigen ligase